MRIKTQHGMALLEGLLIIVAISLIGLVGYKVTQTRNSVDKANTASDSQTVSDVSKLSSPAPVAAVKTAADLNKSDQELDQINAEDNGADLSQIDNELSDL